jgi:hypothetical protein
VPKLNVGQTLRHSCGLVFRNITKRPIEFQEDECPQCHTAIVDSHITTGSGDTVTWTLIPPHGMAFKNSMGSEVTISFPRGQETELFQALQHQLNSLLRASLPGLTQGQTRTTPGRGQPIRIPKLTVNDEGELVASDDEVASAAVNALMNQRPLTNAQRPDLPNGPTESEDDVK